MSRVNPGNEKWANVKSVTGELDRIPRSRLMRKMRKTAFGVVLVASGASGQLWLGWPWWASLGFAVIGAYTISGDLMSAGTKFLAGTAKDLVAIVTKKNGSDG